MTLVPAYTPTDWVDTVTTVDESKMDKIDLAVGQHATAINGLDTRMVTQEGKPALPAVVNGKWIKGVGGAAVWSDITQADVSGLTAALTAKQDISAKGAASGYAPLDASSKVPVANLPTPIDLRYAGAYSAATAYKEGDVVIQAGIAYMALRPSTGETPTPWSTSVVSPTYGWDSITTLAADIANATTTMADIGLSVALLANTTYEIEIMLLTNSSAGTNGLRHMVNFSGAGALLSAVEQAQTTATAAAQLALSLATATVTMNTFVGDASAVIKGFIEIAAAAGNMTIQQAKMSTGTATCRAGSNIKIRKAT